MIATIPAVSCDAGTVPKGNYFRRLQMVVLHKGELQSVIDVRFYGQTRVTAVIWLRTADGRYFRGVGRAGGGGYDKQSAALQDALDDAGIKLSEPIDGRGDGAMDDALQAIADACGYTGMRVIV